MKWMDRVWALLVLAAAAVLGALLCGHIVDAKQAQTALLLVATTALLVLAGTLAWIEKQLRIKRQRLVFFFVGQQSGIFLFLQPPKNKTRRCRFIRSCGMR